MADKEEWSEKAKMISGGSYYSGDAQLVEDRANARRILDEFNTIPVNEVSRSTNILKGFLERLE